MKKSNQYSYSDLLSVTWIAVCAFVLCFGISESIQYQFSLQYSIAVCFATFFIYTVPNVKNSRLDLNFILALISIVLAGVFYLFIPFQLSTFFVEGSLFIVSTLYVLPPTKYKPAVREVPGIKMFVIALVWVCSCYYIPTINNGTAINWFFTAALFFFFLSIIIPFDIRDVRNDDQNLRTIPQIIGVKNSIRLALSFSLISLLLVSFSEPSSNFLIIYSCFIILNLALIASLKYIMKSKLYFILLDTTILILGFVIYFSI